MSQAPYPRDLVGYGARAPHADWPGGARIALQIVLNYEEGAERSVLLGDAASETFLSEIVGAVPFAGARHMSMESLYEYGSRAGGALSRAAIGHTVELLHLSRQLRDYPQLTGE